MKPNIVQRARDLRPAQHRAGSGRPSPLGLGRAESQPHYGVSASTWWRRAVIRCTSRRSRSTGACSRRRRPSCRARGRAPTTRCRDRRSTAIQGTSMAGPHVAGVAALIMSRYGRPAEPAEREDATRSSCGAAQSDGRSAAVSDGATGRLRSIHADLRGAAGVQGRAREQLVVRQRPGGRPVGDHARLRRRLARGVHVRRSARRASLRYRCLRQRSRTKEPIMSEHSTTSAPRRRGDQQ